MTTIVVILLIAAGLRWLALRSVKTYSPADKAVYAEQVRWLNSHRRKSYLVFVDAFIANPKVHNFPSPLRWGYIFVAAAWCRLFRASNERTLAVFSSICGLGIVAMSWVFAHQLVSATAAA